MGKVTVADDRLGDLTAQFFNGLPADLLVGARITRFFKMAWDSDTVNTVIVGGASTFDGSLVQATNSATAHVLTASVACQQIVTSRGACACDITGEILLPRPRPLLGYQFLDAFFGDVQFVSISNMGEFEAITPCPPPGRPEASAARP